MSHHIRRGQAADGNVLHPFQHPDGILQTGHFIPRQVNLGYIACNDDFRAEAQSGQKHFHLLFGGILGFIQNNKAVVQGSAPHIGKGCHLNGAPLLVLLKSLRPQHIIQGIIQGTQVGVYLVLQITGKESQPLPCLHRRTGQDDSVDGAFPKRSHRSSHSKVGFACTGRPHADGHSVLFHGPHIFLLTDCFGFDRLTFGSNADNILCNLGYQGLVSFRYQCNQITNPLLVDLLSFGSQSKQTFQSLYGLAYGLFVAGNLQLRFPVDNHYTQCLFNSFDVLIKGTKYRNQIFHSFRIYRSLGDFSHAVRSPSGGLGRIRYNLLLFYQFIWKMSNHFRKYAANQR